LRVLQEEAAFMIVHVVHTAPPRCQ
jgi:hypothetical protein